jgi:cytochrome c oxidase cbb3-type subunit 3
MFCSFSGFEARWMLVCALSGALGLGCQRSRTAPNGAPPPVPNPIGHVPGALTQPAKATNPLRADSVARARGRQLFLRYNCAGCHGDHAGGGMGPSLRDPSWLYGKTDADVFSSIAEGRAHGMPAWGTKLPESQLWELVAYIQCLRTDEEPDKPNEAIPPPPSAS